MSIERENFLRNLARMPGLNILRAASSKMKESRAAFESHPICETLGEAGGQKR